MQGIRVGSARLFEFHWQCKLFPDHIATSTLSRVWSIFVAHLLFLLLHLLNLPYHRQGTAPLH